MCKNEKMMVGGKIPYIRVGKSKLMIVLNGEKFEITLNNILYAPQLDQNLMSVKRACQVGSKLTEKSNVLNKKIDFT